MEKDIKLKLRLSRMDRSLLVAVPVTMILVFFVLLAMLSAYQREAVVSTVRVSHTLAANQRNQLDVYLVGRVEMLKLLAQQPDVYSMNLERQRAFAARWTASSGFSHLFFVDNNGQGWYPLENGGTYRNQAGEQFFQDISTHDDFVTDPFLKDDGPITTVCVAIRRPDGTRVGTLCGAFYLSNVQNAIDDNQVIYGGKCYVLDKEGRHISLDGDNSWSYDSLTGDSDAEVALLEQVYESGDDLDGEVKIDGADQYASIAVLSKAPWVVMVCVPA
ncbi:MAG: cache domain-containing protein, partial [Selenomonas bovis]